MFIDMKVVRRAWKACPGLSGVHAEVLRDVQEKKKAKRRRLTSDVSLHHICQGLRSPSVQTLQSIDTRS